MKEYMLINRVPLSYSADDAKQARETWNKVTDKWKEDGIFVTSFVIPNEGYTISGAERTVKKETAQSGDLKIVSVIILRAESFEEVLELAKACPILEQGGKVEVSEVQPRPVQAK